MPLRIAFDMDGVLADFESAFREIEVRLFGEDAPPPEQPEVRAAEEERSETPRRRASDREQKAAGETAGEAVAGDAAGEAGDSGAAPAPESGTDESPRIPTRRKLDRVWAAIASTPNFWSTLKPIDPTAVPRIREMTIRHGWEVFFITQRPKTAGETVQRQTQRWLVEQGFDWPSVLVMPGSRGKAAAALHLDFLVDDSPKNCIDVISDSRARALLIVRERDDRIDASAKRLGIGVVRSIAECLDVLDEATEVHAQPGLLGRLARLVGWRS